MIIFVTRKFAIKYQVIGSNYHIYDLFFSLRTYISLLFALLIALFTVDPYES